MVREEKSAESGVNDRRRCCLEPRKFWESSCLYEMVWCVCVITAVNERILLWG